MKRHFRASFKNLLSTCFLRVGRNESFLKLYKLFIFVFLFLSVNQANAYLQYAPNANLMEEVDANPFRILPRSDHYAFAVDTDFFKPLFLGAGNTNYYRYDFYHGNGYWLSLRSELKPVQNLTLNLKLNMTHGTSSNGPTYLAQIFPMVGITFQDDLFGFHLKGRLSDIGRQTTGVGLFIEEKETEGGYFLAEKNDFKLKIMVDGTGSYRIDGGVIASDISFWNGLLGGVLFIQETETPYHPPALMETLYSKHEWGKHFSYGVEAGLDINSWAAMSFVRYENNFGNFHFWLKPQLRHYGARVLGELPGKISQNYVSYDQNDKAFMNIMNVFPYGDDVTTYSSQLNAEWLMNWFYRFYTELEGVSFQFKQRSSIRQLFYRAGVKFFPLKNREENFGFLIGNKYLISSTTLSPESSSRTYSQPGQPDFENKPLFMSQLYVMFNFESRF